MHKPAQYTSVGSVKANILSPTGKRKEPEAKSVTTLHLFNYLRATLQDAKQRVTSFTITLNKREF